VLERHHRQFLALELTGTLIACSQTTADSPQVRFGTTVICPFRSNTAKATSPTCSTLP
jgi:hypothetical protein